MFIKKVGEKQLLRCFCTSVYDEVCDNNPETILIKTVKLFSTLSPVYLILDITARYGIKRNPELQYWVQFFTADTHSYSHSHAHTVLGDVLWCYDTFGTRSVWSVILHVTRTGKIIDKEPEGKQNNFILSVACMCMCICLSSLEVKCLVLKLH